jgi:flagellar biosynthetic protein FliQ
VTDSFIRSIFIDAFWTVIMVSGPLLGLSLLVGLVISVLQATTSIHEQTLTFVPKIAAVAVAMLIFGPWMSQKLVGFTTKILGNLDQFTFIKVMVKLFI